MRFPLVHLFYIFGTDILRGDFNHVTASASCFPVVNIDHHVAIWMEATASERYRFESKGVSEAATNIEQ